MSCICVAASLLAGRVLFQAVPAPKKAPIPKPPAVEVTEYDGDAGVAMGEVVDYDAVPACAGERRQRDGAGNVTKTMPCAPLRLLELRVTHSFYGSRLGDVFFHLYPGNSRAMPEAIHKGDVVIVTFDRHDVVDSWSCGRLMPCDRAPQYLYMARELFHRFSVPIEQESAAEPK